jgi:hypothetical protein
MPTNQWPLIWVCFYMIIYVRTIVWCTWLVTTVAPLINHIRCTCSNHILPNLTYQISQSLTITILKHTNDIGNWISLSYWTNFSNVLQYSVTLLTTFNGWGRALSDCHRQALFLVATKLVGTDGNAPRALTSLPWGTDLQSAVVGNPLKIVLPTGLAPIIY